MGDADVCFLHTSQFVFSQLSVGDIWNLLNILSGCIMFLPPNINIVSLSVSTVTLSFSFCSVSKNDVC
jgi:hypothetical protein